MKHVNRSKKGPINLVALAHHEAGHVVVAHCLGLDYAEVSIVPDAENYGSTEIESPLFRWRPEDGSKEELARKYVLSLLAGRAAEEQFLGTPTGGSWTDEERADNVILNHLSRGGAFGDDAFEQLKDGLRRETVTLVRKLFPRIRLVAEALLAEKTLSADRVRAILEATMWREPGAVAAAH